MWRLVNDPYIISVEPPPNFDEDSASEDGGFNPVDPLAYYTTLLEESSTNSSAEDKNESEGNSAAAPEEDAAGALVSEEILPSANVAVRENEEAGDEMENAGTQIDEERGNTRDVMNADSQCAGDAASGGKSIRTDIYQEPELAEELSRPESPDIVTSDLTTNAANTHNCIEIPLQQGEDVVKSLDTETDLTCSKTQINPDTMATDVVDATIEQVENIVSLGGKNEVVSGTHHRPTGTDTEQREYPMEAAARQGQGIFLKPRWMKLFKRIGNSSANLTDGTSVRNVTKSTGRSQCNEGVTMPKVPAEQCERSALEVSLGKRPIEQENNSPLPQEEPGNKLKRQRVEPDEEDLPLSQLYRSRARNSSTSTMTGKMHAPAISIDSHRSRLKRALSKIKEERRTKNRKLKEEEAENKKLRGKSKSARMIEQNKLFDDAIRNEIARNCGVATGDGTSTGAVNQGEEQSADPGKGQDERMASLKARLPGGTLAVHKGALAIPETSGSASEAAEVTIRTFSYEGHGYEKKLISQPISCGFCTRLFPNQEGLAKHIKRVHPKEVAGEDIVETVVCMYCNMSLRNEINLRRHVVNVHLADTKFHCRICGAKFGSTHSHAAHLREAHLGNENGAAGPSNAAEGSTSDIDGVQAADKTGSDVDGVQADDQTASTTAECEGEGSTKRRKSRTTAGAVQTGRSLYMFVCNACGMYSSTRGNLERHIRIRHLQERRYVCCCGKKFPTKNNLQCHRLSKLCERAVAEWELN